MSDINTYVDQPPNPTKGRMSVQDIKAYILKLVMLHFSDVRHIRNPSLRDNVFRAAGPDPAAPTTIIPSSIVITTRGKFDPAQTAKRPAIILKRGATTYTRDLAFGAADQSEQPLLGTPGHNPTHDATAGGRRYNYAGETSFTLFCVHIDEVAAEILGEEVQQMLLGFRELIICEKNLHEFMPDEAGEAGMLDEYKEMWVVPVKVTVKYRLDVHLLAHTPLLKGLLLRLKSADGTGTLG